jgi:Secretion system C-terminal sorting domain
MRKIYFMLFAVCSMLSLSITGQPTVFYTNLTSTTSPVLTNSRLNLTDLGAFRQTRFQTTNTPAPGTQTYAFHVGTDAAPDYNNNWRPYIPADATGIVYALNVVTVPSTVVNSARYNSGGGGTDGNLAALANNTYYTVNIQENATADNLSAIWSTTFNPVTFSGIVQAPVAGSVAPGIPVAVSITASVAPAFGENVFVRYSTNGFVTSSVSQASFTGTTGTALLPGQTAGTNVSYYIFSSNRSITQLATIVGTTGIGQAGYDMATLNLENNAGSNYSYTVNAGPNPVTINATGGTATADYGTLKGAFDAINAGTHTGAISVLINASTTETATAVLNASGTGSASYTNITINPTAAGVAVAGALSGGLVNLDGASNVTIDGRIGSTGTLKDLTFENTNTSGFAIQFVNQAASDTIRYTVIRSNNTGTSSGTVVFGTVAAGTVGNSNDCIENCDIRETTAGTTPANAVYSNGSSSGPNINNTLRFNNVYNFFATSASQGILLNSNSLVWTISGNSLYQTVARSGAATTHTYINIATGNGHTVSGNFIGGTQPNCGGSPLTYSAGTAARFIGIRMGPSNSTVLSSVTNNTIANFDFNTSSGATTIPGIWCGIFAASAGCDITNNIIGSNTGTGNIKIASSTTGAAISSYGICTNAAGLGAQTYNFSNNQIGSIRTFGTTGSVNVGFEGISISGNLNSAAVTYNITNNTIGSTTTALSINAANPTTGSAAQSVIGINNIVTNGINSVFTATGNTIANLSDSASNGATVISTVRGIICPFGTANISNNTIFALSNYALYNASTSSNMNVMGIVCSSPQQVNINDNRIYNLTAFNAQSASSTSVVGIAVSGGGSFTNSIQRNLVYNLNSESNFTGSLFLYGLNIQNSSLSTNTIYNNMIRLGVKVNGTYNTRPYSRFYGINDGNAVNRIYYNTIAIVGDTTAAIDVSGGGAPTVALFSSNTNAKDWRNNIFFNTRVTTGDPNARNFCVALTTTTGARTSDYNSYHIPVAGGVVGTYSTITGTFYTTLSAWQGILGAGSDANSVADRPVFVAETAATPNLHLVTNANCGLDGQAVVITGLTTDYDNDTRDVTTPDIGADEFVSVPPTANAGGNQSICGGNTYTISGATAANNSGVNWTTSGDGTFLNGTTLTPTYTPGVLDNTAGTVTLTLTATGNGSCSNATSNMTLTITNTLLLAGIPGGPQVCQTKVVGIGATYNDPSCNTIASVIPAGASPVSGSITGCVKVETSIPVYASKYYVARHYDIEPAVAPSTSSASVTLYFSPAEMAAFNADMGAAATHFPLPVLPTDNTDSVRIEQYHGTGTNPTNYTGALETWSTANGLQVVFSNGYWAITVPVTSFSGFWLTAKLRSPLPVTVEYFRGAKSGSSHNLTWKVSCTNTPFATMTLERSSDGRNFGGIYTITASATRCLQAFDHADTRPLNGINYYRLKMADADGKVTYSTIVALTTATKGFEVINITPNPVTEGRFKLNVTAAEQLKMELVITDITGKVVATQSNTLIAGFNAIDVNVSKLAIGTYQVTGITAEGRTKTMQFVKQ